MAGVNSLSGPFVKLARSLREKGLKGTVLQLYGIGDLKFGEFKGKDKFGNCYYEDLTAPYGQHRWVEYSNIHNYDATMIQPEWHGWMHHMYDETPDQINLEFKDRLETAEGSDAIYDNHLGKASFDAKHEQVDLSQYRSRGYKVGSLMTGPDEPDRYYKQPGHPLSPIADKGGRFSADKRKEMTSWEPSNESSNK